MPTKLSRKNQPLRLVFLCLSPARQPGRPDLYSTPQINQHPVPAQRRQRHLHLTTFSLSERA
ncbi:hypothetical protein C1N59_06985 [Pantoea sp. SGAir0183]